MGLAMKTVRKITYGLTAAFMTIMSACVGFLGDVFLLLGDMLHWIAEKEYLIANKISERIEDQ